MHNEPISPAHKQFTEPVSVSSDSKCLPPPRVSSVCIMIFELAYFLDTLLSMCLPWVNTVCGMTARREQPHSQSTSVSFWASRKSARLGFTHKWVIMLTEISNYAAIEGKDVEFVAN